MGRALPSQCQQSAHSTRSRALQQQVIAELIGGRGLPGLVGAIAEHAEAEVWLFDADFDLLAAFPEPLDAGQLVPLLKEVARPSRARDTVSWVTTDRGRMAFGDVRAGSDFVGWLCLAPQGPQSDQETELALTQAALAVAVQHLQEQAAIKARATMRQDVLLHLLFGSEDERRAATARAKYVNIDLKGKVRVAVCSLVEPSGLASHGAWGQATLDTTRRRLLGAAEEALAEAGISRSLGALHGGSMVFLIRSGTSVDLRSALDGISSRLGVDTHGLQPRWGVSADREGTAELPSAYEEARAASHLAASTQNLSVAIFEELGVLGLLLSGPEGSHMQQFVDRTIGPVLEHDERRNADLLLTLRTWLDCNCSQQDAAAALFVHQKTVRYRLSLIEKLTGLDLNSHQDRMRADLAVRSADLH